MHSTEIRFPREQFRLMGCPKIATTQTCWKILSDHRIDTVAPPPGGAPGSRRKGKGALREVYVRE